MTGAIGIARLAGRRALLALLPGAFCFALLAWLNSAESALRPDLQIGRLLRIPTPGDRDRARLTSMAVWCLVPFLVHHSASIAHDWESRRGKWIGSRGIPRAAAIGAWWLGVWCGACVIVALSVLAIESSLPQSAGPRSLGRVHHQGLILQGAGDSSRLSLREVPRGTVALRARFATTLGGDPSAGIRAHVRAVTTLGAPVEAKGFGTFCIDIPIAWAAPEVAVELTMLSDGPGCGLAGSSIAALGAPVPSRAGTLWVAVRVAIALAAISALAMGAGAYLHAVIASLLVACPWIVAWTRIESVSWWPGGQLPAAFEQLSEGLVPTPPNTVTLLVVGALVTTGLALATIGLAPGRRT